MPNGIRMNAPHAVIGLCVMALGFALVFDRLGVVPAEQVLQYWPLGLVLLGASMVFQALRGSSESARAGFPIGAAIWLVILGLFLTHVFDRRGSARDNRENQVRLFAIMSGDQRSVVDTAFHGADMTAVMGGVRLDLRKARVPPGEEVVVDVFAMMGGAELNVPREWTVDMQAVSVMGGIKDSRNQPVDERNRSRRRGQREGVDADLPATPPVPPVAPVAPVPPVPPVDSSQAVERADTDTPAGQPPRLVVRGVVMMGGMEIKP